MNQKTKDKITKSIGVIFADDVFKIIEAEENDVIKIADVSIPGAHYKLLEKCKKLGIEPDIGKRWENGIAHHPEAEKIFELLKTSDWFFGGDYFCWKSGGDGDNGETLMYALSVLLEFRDKRLNGEDTVK